MHLQKFYESADKAGAFAKVQNVKEEFLCLVSLVISQGPGSFKQARETRQKLFQLLGPSSSCYFPTDLLRVLPSLRLTAKKRDLLERLAACFERKEDCVDGGAWRQLAGIGRWTRKAFDIMTGTDPRICLSEDSHVRKRMAALGVAWSDIPAGWETRMSRLFWRLTDQGVSSITSGATEVKEGDFYS